jgi:hypothetical protein
VTEPSHDLAAGAERWSAYLDYFRTSIAAAVAALPEAELRTTRLPSGWTPIELLSHLLHMEQRWFVWGFLGEDVAEPWGDWDVDDPWNEGVEGRWTVAEGVRVDDLTGRLERIGERTRAVLAAYPLEAVATSGGRFDGDPPDLEWICFHVLQEYARHAGHLDIVVELAGVAAAGQ